MKRDTLKQRWLPVAAVALATVAAFCAQQVNRAYGVRVSTSMLLTLAAGGMGYGISLLPQIVGEMGLGISGGLIVIAFVLQPWWIVQVLVWIAAFWIGAVGGGVRLPQRQVNASGQAYIEFLLVLPLFLTIIAGVIGFGQAMYVKLATEASAWSGTRHGTATLNYYRGVWQSMIGARYTLHGFALNPESAHVTVHHWGGWDRGADIRTEVCYNVPPPPVPYGDVMFPQRICSEQVMPIEYWQSRW
jgi:hypothetical protein